MKKKQKILSVQANALSSINIKTDTTLLLCSEAQKRGFKIFWYETKNLSIQNTRVFAKGYFVNFSNEKKVFYKIIKKTELDLSKSDYLLVRKNPPFNMDYVI